MDKLNPNEVTDAVSAIQDGLAWASHHTLTVTHYLAQPHFQSPLLDSHSFHPRPWPGIFLLTSPVTQEQNLLCLGKKSYSDFHNSSLNSKPSHPLNYENWYFARGFCLFWMPMSKEIFAKYSFFLNSQSFKMPWRYSSQMFCFQIEETKVDKTDSGS